jgi:hypothetical protein
VRTLFYDDPCVERPIANSVFLAGPTARGIRRTPWRAEALELLAARGFDGTVLLPELRDGEFEVLAPRLFASPPSPAPGLRDVSFNILRWETGGIENVTVVVFWMPFSVGAEHDPASLPGFTTRAEVSRELARDASRIVLGMPADAVSGSHIRYHAHRAAVPIAATLAATIELACTRLLVS